MPFGATSQRLPSEVRKREREQLSLKPPATDYRRCRIGHESIDAIWSYQPTTTVGGEEARAGNSHR
eukprot:COSAG02_NODE_3559_length_6563_cov_4.152382_3_plen_66_part_00